MMRPDFAAPVDLLGRPELDSLRWQRHRRERARLGHAPALHDAHAELILEPFDERPRHGRASAEDSLHRREVDRVLLAVVQQVGPDRRHRARAGGLLLLDEARERLGLEEAIRHDEVGTGHPRGVGHTPRVGMKHRDDRQHAVAIGEVDRTRLQHSQRVQERRTMRVDDTLRVARGAARVAHRGRGRVRRSPGRRRRVARRRAARRSGAPARGCPRAVRCRRRPPRCSTRRSTAPARASPARARACRRR